MTWRRHSLRLNVMTSIAAVQTSRFWRSALSTLVTVGTAISALACASVAAPALWQWVATMIADGPTAPPADLVIPSVVTTVLAAGLAMLLRWSKVLLRTEGTLLYVAALDAGTTDPFTRVMEDHTAYHRRVALRSVQRRISYQDTTASGGSQHDAAQFTARLARDVEAQMNQAGCTSDIHIAPNMTWPVAFGVGYQSSLWRSTQLLELATPRTASYLHENRLAQQFGMRPLPDMSWSPHPRPRSRPDLSQMEVVIRHNTDTDPVTTSAFNPELFSSIGQPTNVRSVIIGIRFDQTAGNSQRLLAGEFHPDVRISIKGRPMEINGNRAEDSSRIQSYNRSRYSIAWQSAHEIAHVIAHAGHTFPNAVICLAPDTPQTIAFAVGWLLSDLNNLQFPLPDHNLAAPRPCMSTGCRNRMHRLVLLQWHQAQTGGKWELVRIHRDQMTTERQIRAVNSIFRAYGTASLPIATQSTTP